MTLQSFREKVNLSLYDSRSRVDKIRKFMLIFVAICSMVLLAIYYGFPQTQESKELLISLIQTGFLFYVINYCIQFVYTYEPIDFLKRTWFEGIIILLLIAEGISHTLTGNLLLISLFEKIGIVNISGYYALFVQVYFLLFVLSEVFIRSNAFPIIKLDPALVFISTFILIILTGTVLLMMPEMTKATGSMPFLDALFTATSASCVTGLIVVDTATYFSIKGQFIIMMLIVVGGINIISFGSFISIASKLGVTLKHHSVIEGFVNKSSAFSAKSMLGKIAYWVGIFLLLSTIAIFFSWGENVTFTNFGDKLFFSIFHAISAFYNAGFSIFTDGMHNISIRDNTWLQLTVAFTIFFGSLGILTLIDIFSLKRIIDRFKNPWKQWEFGTKIAFYFSIVLVLAGSILIFLLEYNHTLYNSSFFSASVHAFFQSVSSRTAGFNTLDLSLMSIPALLVLIFLMFIGASSGSTGGGIKTSTFALIFAAIVSTIRDDKNVSLFKRTIPNELILRAFSVLLFFITGILISLLLLCITESAILCHPQFGFMSLLFEVVSSFSTVGLSTGITSSLTDSGKVIIIFSMFIGRVGALTIAFALGKKVISNRYKYPSGHTMVG